MSSNGLEHQAKGHLLSMHHHTLAKTLLSSRCKLYFPGKPMVLPSLVTMSGDTVVHPRHGSTALNTANMRIAETSLPIAEKEEPVKR